MCTVRYGTVLNLFLFVRKCKLKPHIPEFVTTVHPAVQCTSLRARLHSQIDGGHAFFINPRVGSLCSLIHGEGGVLGVNSGERGTHMALGFVGSLGPLVKGLW